MRLKGKVAIITGAATGLQGSVMGFGGAAAWRFLREGAKVVVTDIDSDRPKKGLDEEIIKFISQKKNEPEWMLSWRINSYKKWLKLPKPEWANLNFPEIDFQDIYYYSAPKGFEKKTKRFKRGRS